MLVKKGRHLKLLCVFVTALIYVNSYAQTTPQYINLVTEAYNNNLDMNNGVAVPIGVKFGGLYSSNSSNYIGNNPTYNWQKERRSIFAYYRR